MSGSASGKQKVPLLAAAQFGDGVYEGGPINTIQPTARSDLRTTSAYTAISINGDQGRCCPWGCCSAWCSDYVCCCFCPKAPPPDVDALAQLARLHGDSQKELITKLELTPRETQLTARAVLLFKKLREDGIRILNRWTFIYCVATICNVLTPILIGLTHDDGISKDVQNVLKWTSIAFSILAIVLHSVDAVYNGRDRGRAMIEGGNQIWFLYESFSGLVPDPHEATIDAPKTEHTDWDYIEKVPRAALKAHLADLDERDKVRKEADPAPPTADNVSGIRPPSQHTGARFESFYAKFVQAEESARKTRYAGFGVDA